jgi:hypothetical protein
MTPEFKETNAWMHREKTERFRMIQATAAKEFHNLVIGSHPIH